MLDWTTVAIAATALVIACVSFTMNLFQFVTRHRPLIMVRSLGLAYHDLGEDPRYLNFIRICISNNGQVASKKVDMTVQQSTSRSFEPTSEEYVVGSIFASESVTYDIAIGSKHRDDLESGTDGLSVVVSLNYGGPWDLLRRFPPFHKHTYQAFLIDWNNGGVTRDLKRPASMN